MTQPPNKAQSIRSFRFLPHGIKFVEGEKENKKKENWLLNACPVNTHTPLSIAIKIYRILFVLRAHAKKFIIQNQHNGQTIFHAYPM